VPESRGATPYLVVKGASDAIAFYQRIFGAELLFRLDEPGGGVMHAELQVGPARFMLTEERPQQGTLSPRTLGGSGSGATLYVPDADAVVERAVKAGAQLQMPVQDQFWGDRAATSSIRSATSGSSRRTSRIRRRRRSSDARRRCSRRRPAADIQTKGVLAWPTMSMDSCSGATASMDAYRAMAERAAKVWKEHGALQVWECWADDVKPGKVTSFPQAVQLKDDETVVFSWIVFRSREERDVINKKVMEDPRLADMMDPKQMPFRRDAHVLRRVPHHRRGLTGAGAGPRAFAERSGIEPGGATKPPSSRSASSANASGVRSSRYGRSPARRPAGPRRPARSASPSPAGPRAMPA
jgi:uncharacterized protein YbaA (DUF1428 family)/uncharacterized glyoxalase superfamily protein PhnB